MLAGIGAASLALAQSPSITLLRSAGSNGGTLVNGVCALPVATGRQPCEAFLLTSNGAVNAFTTTTSGSRPARKIGHVSCFLCDGDRVFLTYSTTGRGTEAARGSLAMPDMTP
jgi:hypothetical protein